MTKQLIVGAVLAIVVAGSWTSEASAFGRRCGRGSAANSAPTCPMPAADCCGNPATYQAGRETWYGVHLYEANGQYAGRFENPGYSNVVNYCNGWVSGGAGRYCSAIYSFQYPLSQYGPSGASTRSLAIAAYAPQGTWSPWYNLPYQPGQLSTAYFEPYNPTVTVFGEIKFINLSGQAVTQAFFNKQAGFWTNSQPQVRFSGWGGATGLNAWAIP